MIKYFIKNYTPYIGNIVLKFEKFPHYTGGGSSGMLNKIHINLFFTKLVSRMIPFYENGRWLVDEKKVNKINELTGGVVGKHQVNGIFPLSDGVLHDSFLTKNGEYIGNIETGWWYVNSNFIVSEKHPHGVAAKVDKNRNIIGYYGFSHRGGTLFKVGDKLFDEKWKLQCKEDWKNDFLISFFKGYQSNPEDSIPFKKRGSVTIKNLNQAEQAAINFSNYLS